MSFHEVFDRPNIKIASSVLIGDDFQDKVGELGTYQAFIHAVNEFSLNYPDRIYREFLGMEPREAAKEVKL